MLKAEDLEAGTIICKNNEVQLYTFDGEKYVVAKDGISGMLNQMMSSCQEEPEYPELLKVGQA